MRESRLDRGSRRNANRGHYNAPLKAWRKKHGLTRKQADRYAVAIRDGATEEEALALVKRLPL